MTFACRNPKLSVFFLIARFSDLEPSWDYTWYNGHALDGFEDEIEGLLTSSDAVPKLYASYVAQAFALQRAYVNSCVSASSK